MHDISRYSTVDHDHKMNKFCPRYGCAQELFGTDEELQLGDPASMPGLGYGAYHRGGADDLTGERDLASWHDRSGFPPVLV